jgi:hypothetical protein
VDGDPTPRCAVGHQIIDHRCEGIGIRRHAAVLDRYPHKAQALLTGDLRLLGEAELMLLRVGQAGHDDADALPLERRQLVRQPVTAAGSGGDRERRIDPEDVHYVAGVRSSKNEMAMIR